MRRMGHALAVAALGLMVALPVVGQQPEQMVRSGLASGGFGAPVVKVTGLARSTALLVGGRGAWVVNHVLAVGGGGYSLRTTVHEPRPAPGAPGRLLDLSYGGLEVEYIHPSHALLHGSAGILVGGGWVSYRQVSVRSRNGLFVIEPALNVLASLAEHVHVGLGGSYRFVSGVTLDGLRNSDLNGPALALEIRFGSF